jgi:hypothetical protein
MILNKDKVVLWLPSRCGEKMMPAGAKKALLYPTLKVWVWHAHLWHYLRTTFVSLVFDSLLSDWAKTPNNLAMYINFIITMPVDAFLTISTGLRNAISRLVILAYGFPIFLIVLH